MADDIVDPFEGIVDPFASPKAAAAPKNESTWSRAITDIPGEIGKEFAGAKDDVTALARRGEMGPVEGLMATGKAALAPVRAAFAIPVGAAHATLGHGMANLVRAAGENIVNPIVEKLGGTPQHPSYEELYEKSKEDVDKALAAARPAGVPVKVAPSVPAPRGPHEIPAGAPAWQIERPAPPAVNPPPTDHFGVTLTEGERTGDLAARQREQAALRGQSGAPAQRHAEEFFNQQRPEQLAEAKTNVLQELDPTGRQVLAENPQQAAQLAQESLQREFGRSKQGVKQEYDRAKGLGGDIDTNYFNDMVYSLKNDLLNRPDGGIIVNERTPVAANMTDYLNQRIAQLKIRNDVDPLNPMGTDANGNMVVHGPQGNLINVTPRGITLAGVEEWRKTLSQMRGSALKNFHNNAEDARAAQALLDGFDAKITQAVNSGAFNGDPAAVRAWNNARAAHAEHMKKFGNDAVGRRLREIIGGGRFDDPAGVGAVSDYLFSTSGTKPAEINVALAKRVKKILGEDSPEWAAIRQGMLHKVISTAEGVPELGPGVSSKRLANFLNSDMASVMLSPAQRQLLGEYSQLQRTMSIPLQGANWSNTATGVIPHIKKATGHILGAIGGVIGHAVSPIVGGAAGFALGEGAGYLLRSAENSKNLRQVSQQLPLVGQRLRQWQQAQFSASTKATVASEARRAVAANNLVLALERVGIGHDAAMRLLATGPESTSPSQAQENKRIEVPVYKEGRATGGRVPFADGGVPTFDERFTGSTPDNPSADDMVDSVRNRTAARDNIAPDTAWAEKEAQSNLALQPQPQKSFLDQASDLWEGTKDAAKRFSQYDRQFTEDVLNLPRRAYEHSDDLKKGLKNLLGMGEEERYQLWPEKMVRSGASLPHDVMSGEVPQYEMDPKTGEWHTSTPMIERTQDLAGMAGSGGLGAGTTDATLGSAPFLRPALKYEGKIYKAPMGGQHLDAIPKEIYPEFQRQAMSGEDISNFNFGFMNHKGHFMDREAALDYAVKEGLIDPRDARQGALTTTLLEDSSKPGSAVAGLAKSAEPFYSATEQALSSASQKKMHGEQWANWLKNQPGVKPDELQYTGLDNWLREQKGLVTKEQVQEHLNNNKVEVRDIVKGDKAKAWKNLSPAEKEKWKIDYSNETGTTRELVKLDDPDLIEYYNDYAHQGSTKYHDYALPGGKNYREHLLTLPIQGRRIGVRPSEEGPLEAYDTATGRTVRNSRGDDNEMLAWAEAENKKGQPTDPREYKSPHWGEPNVLAHMRTNERDVGGVPSLHIEEIQSDWHQQGRDKGYRNEGRTKQVIQKELDGLLGELRNRTGEYLPTDKHWAEHKDISAKFDALSKELKTAKNGSEGVPDAPFKTSWAELALKRMIRMAAEEGKTRVSWTPGEAQAARYGLSKHITEVRAYEQAPGKFDLLGLRKEGGSYHTFGKDLNKEQIAEYIGKDAAQKLLEKPAFKTAGGDTYELKGADLKVGGEGMKGFYDNMLPKMVEKLGKKYGVKVKEAETGSKLEIKDRGDGKFWGAVIKPDGSIGQTVVKDTKEQVRSFLEPRIEKNNKKLKYFDIPEKMKEDVLSKGFPLFSDTGHAAPITALEKGYKLAGTGERGMVVGSGATMPSHQPISVARHFKDVAYPHAKMERGDWARYNRAVENGDHVEVDLPLRSLNATQKTVNPDFMSVRNDELPAVMKKGGEYYVQDGHHRLMREAASGKQTARVRLYDVDPSTKDPRQLTLLSGNDAAAPIAALEYLTTGQLDDAARAVAGRKYEQLDRNQQQRVQKLALETVYAKNDAAAPVSALERAPVWYSPVEHALEQSTQGSATGAQWLATIRNSRGVKPEELDWTGLRQFLEERADKPVTRPELHEYLRDNRVELQDVTKSGKAVDTDALMDEARVQADREMNQRFPGMRDSDPVGYNDRVMNRSHWIFARLVGNVEWLGSTKYHDYALPGGENYREHLITMPGKMKEAQDLLNDPGRDLRTREFEELYRTAQGYRSSHWDEPNIVAHVRSNVREMPSSDGQGSVRSLHLEEVQSDWHQAGRRGGYQPDTKTVERIVARDRETRNAFDDAVLNAYKEHFGNHDNVTMRHVNSWRDRVLQADGKIDELPSWANVPEVKHTAQEYSNAFNEAVALDRKKKQGVPDAPWKKTWHELALRRMIRLAAEEGMDRISWTPGEAQAARYDLSKTIDKLFFMHNSDGTFDLRAQPKGGSTMELGKSVPADKLPDMVGKEMAKKLVEQEKGKGGNFSGLDLKVGGEGMRGFYDKMMVQAAEKLGREYGVKVKEHELPPKYSDVRIRQDGGQFYLEGPSIERPTLADGYSTREAAENALKVMRGPSQKIWYFDIPEKMKEDVLSKGFPLFSDTGHAAPITALEKGYKNVPDSLMGFRKNGPNKGFDEQKYPHVQDVQVTIDGDTFTDQIKGLNKAHALERARRNWPGAKIEAAAKQKEEISRPRQQEKSEAEIKTPERAAGGRVVASNINHAPSEAQKAAGNYAKDHVNIQGLDITIENARGKERNGVGKDGKVWSVKMPAHYGYVKGTEGADGDHVDVYVGPHTKSKKVFIVNQIDADSKEFDEHKALLGFGSLGQAISTYQHGFSDGRALERIGSIVPTDIAHFKAWLKSPHTKKPFKLNA